MIKKIKYDGFDAVEISTAVLKAVLIYEIGPRIAFFGKAGEENLLYWDKDGIARNSWKLYGGKYTCCFDSCVLSRHWH